MKMPSKTLIHLTGCVCVCVCTQGVVNKKVYPCTKEEINED